MYNKLIEIIMYLTPLEYTIRDIFSANTTVTSPNQKECCNHCNVLGYLNILVCSNVLLQHFEVH